MQRMFVVLACCLLTPSTTSRTQQLATSLVDPITEWSVATSAAAAAIGMAPLRTPISLAILHVAMFEAVSAATQGPSDRTIVDSGHGETSSYAAAVEAGYRVLLFEFPTRAVELERTYTTLLTAEPASSRRHRGVSLGASVAARVLDARRNDGRNDTGGYSPGTTQTSWVPTPPGFLAADTAFLAKVRPFVMASPAQFRPAGPLPLESKRWWSDYNEVKTLGSRDSASRTPEQTATALFWEPLAGTVWVPAIRRLAREQLLDLESSARFQAAAFAAFADGLIACWDAKFHFDFWRPVTAIHNGHADGHPATDPDPAWEPLAVTPNFPEYPSGHACASAAVAHVIEDYFRHQVAIPARNIRTGEERIYRHAADVIREVVEARMLLGVHFRTANEDGADIGERIARQLRRDWLR